MDTVISILWMKKLSRKMFSDFTKITQLKKKYEQVLTQSKGSGPEHDTIAAYKRP